MKGKSPDFLAAGRQPFPRNNLTRLQTINYEKSAARASPPAALSRTGWKACATTKNFSKQSFMGLQPTRKS